MRFIKVLAAGLIVLALAFPLVMFCCFNSNLRFNNTLTVSVAPSVKNHSTVPTGRKYVIYLCDGTFPCGGWADRQKGVIAAFVLAQALGRIFKIQITKPCALSDHLSPKSIDWRIKPGELNGLSKTFIKIIDNKADGLRKQMVTMDLEATYPQDILYFTSNMEFSQYLLQNEKYKERTRWMKKYNLRELYVHLLEQIFQFVPDLENKFRNFTSAIPRSKGSKLFCLQVRLGRNPTVPSDTESFNTLKSVDAAWDFIRGLGDLNKHKLFVTSDSEQVRENSKKLFPSNIVDTKGRILHVERYGKPEGLCEGVAKVLLDQRILSTCDVLVISRSGFAMIGAWMRTKLDDLYCFSKGKVKQCHPDKLGYLIEAW
ncbi:uncharacterized protein LOC121388585 [Gigantopelta aegis]|uniref:uncharacterized protein LOC121388585 n=1 Tax=Gigantopelta aegis TaxID=1735272 RepID=UPI001B88A035|nr:uncharacterized protein LOC121388585 [Gigantopelta aegis]XP_041375916.1 uncharacterized protein LOC121388585 [Gigantopelta aegis]